MNETEYGIGPREAISRIESAREAVDDINFELCHNVPGATEFPDLAAHLHIVDQHLKCIQRALTRHQADTGQNNYDYYYEDLDEFFVENVVQGDLEIKLGPEEQLLKMQTETSQDKP
ncbi:hypothetical protein [Halobellus sp. EA9]|uniref:hypothetical protein n=1 Tax=Halobellus sp. EA9 TaxID=3421647 RepID=UPI003EBBF85C